MTNGRHNATSWSSWRIHVLETLERIDDRGEALERQFTKGQAAQDREIAALASRLAVIETKATILGAVSGAVFTLLMHAIF